MPAAKKTAKRKLAPVPMLNAMETFFCHAYIERGKVREAGEAVGLSEVEADAYMQRATVRRYLENYRSKFQDIMAQAEANRLLRKKITRDTIAEQYLYLATMPPERTKGSVEAQVKALDSLVTLLGLKVDPAKLPEALRNMTDEQLAAYAGTAQ